jgi:hypothetical protein
LRGLLLQTGSGKTHTMLGDIEHLGDRPSDNRGMTPRVFEYLFSRIHLVRTFEASWDDWSKRIYMQLGTNVLKVRGFHGCADQCAALRWEGSRAETAVVGLCRRRIGARMRT